MQDLLTYPQALLVLDELNVDVTHMMEHFTVLFAERSEIPIRECLSTVMSCRGDREVMQQDLVDVKRLVDHKLDRLEANLLMLFPRLEITGKRHVSMPKPKQHL